MENKSWKKKQDYNLELFLNYLAKFCWTSRVWFFAKLRERKNLYILEVQSMLDMNVYSQQWNSRCEYLKIVEDRANTRGTISRYYFQTAAL